jgi:hypothetical protein
MKRILSIYFNIDRTYLAAFDVTHKGLDLVYINSTEHPIDLENPDGELTVLAAQELEIFISDIADISELNVTLPAESILLSQIPGRLNMDTHQIKQLVGLEIRQAFPQFNFEDFAPLIVETGERMDGKQMLIAEIIPKNLLNTAQKLLACTNLKINRFEVSQLNAHSALLYNYPEQLDKAAALVSIQQQFIDLSVVKNGHPIYYSLINFNSPDQIAGICENEFNKIMTDYVDYVETAFFFGSGLNIEIYKKAEAKLTEFLMTSVRFNAFRLVSTNLEQREKDYCSRTAHIFPACLGAAVPPFHNHIYLT